MIVAEFVKRNNKTTATHQIEEQHAMPGNGIYEAELQHDNVVEDTINVYSGKNLTGIRVPFVITYPETEPWKRIIHVETTEPTIFITYESTGDQVDADDINVLQDAITATQEFCNSLSDDIHGKTSGFTWNALMGIIGVQGIDISSQPSNASVVAGETATFSITASSTDGNVSYQWQYEDDESSIWNDVENGTDSSIKVITTADMNGRLYQCIVTDTAGNSKTSSAAKLNVSSTGASE